MFQELFKRRQQASPRVMGTLGKNHIFTQDTKDDGFDFGNLLGMGLDMGLNAINQSRTRDFLGGEKTASGGGTGPGEQSSMVSNADPLSMMGTLFGSQLGTAAGAAGAASMSNPLTAGLAVATPILSSLLGGETTKETSQVIPQHENSQASNRVQRQTGPIGGLQPIARQNRWGR